MKIKSYLKKSIVPIFFMLLSIVYVLLLWHKGIILSGDDRIFHIERFEEAYQTLKSGHFLSLISTYSFSKVGQAINTYYPWGNLIPYAILRYLIKNPIYTYYSYIALEQLIGLTLAYLLGKELWSKRSTAAFFAVTFRFSTYVIFNDFARADFGESWGLVFVPLTMLGLVKILKTEKISGTLLLAIGLSLTLYNHILTTIFSILVIVTIYIIALINKRTSINESLKYFILSAIIFIGTTLAVTIPILVGMLNTKISKPATDIFKTKQISFTDLVVASVNNTVEHGNPTIGIILFSAFLFGFLALKKVNRWEQGAYLLGLIFVVLSTTLFPWSLFAKTPVANIQFAWRLVPFASIFLAIYLAAIFNLKVKNKRIFLGITTLICVIFAYGGIQNYSLEQDGISNSEQSLEKKLQNPYGYSLTKYSYEKSLSLNQTNAYNARYGMDYLPQNAVGISDKMYDHIIQVNGKEYTMNSASIIPGYNSMKFVIPAKWLNEKENTVVLPFVVYNKKNYIVYGNGKNMNFAVTKHSQPTITIKRANTVNITIKYQTPKIFLILRYVSLAFLLISIISIPIIYLKTKSVNLKDIAK